MSNTTAKYFAYKGFHPVATIHWAACPHCRFGRGQDQCGKTYVANQLQRGWRPLPEVTEEQALVMVKTGAFRFCGWCCRDLRDGKSA